MSARASAERRRTVLYVDYSLGFGGAIRSLALTLRALPSVERIVVTSQEPPLARALLAGSAVRPFRRRVNYRARARVAALRWAPLRWAALKLMALADVAVSLGNGVWLVWLIRRHGVELVHLNNGFGPREALEAARVTGVPCVVHLRDFVTDARAVATSRVRSVSCVIAVSDAVAHSVGDAGLTTARVVTLHDPVDLDAADAAAPRREEVRRACGLDDDSIAVGMFGRVVPWKGQLEFVRAASAAMRADARIRAVIVGSESDGDTRYLERVRRAIHDSGVAERFVLAGYRPDVEAYYAAMDIVVHASVVPEPFGMVVSEAMAAGRAVIAADGGGPREVVEDGLDGLLVPPCDVDALRGAILRLAASAEERARMGAAGRRKAARRFTMARNAAEVEAVYDALLASRAAGRADSPARTVHA